jgi:nucleotide-binding universal stress UspA family protein
VPIDGSPVSLRAVDLAIEFSMRDGSKLTLLHVVVPPAMGISQAALEEMKKAGESALEMGESRCRSLGLIARKLLKTAEGNRSSTANEIAREAIDGRYDLVILGSRGYAGERGILMGSVAVSLAISLPCTTIIVR